MSALRQLSEQARSITPVVETVAPRELPPRRFEELELEERKVVQLIMRMILAAIEAPDVETARKIVKEILLDQIRGYAALQWLTLLSTAHYWWTAIKLLYDLGLDPELQIKYLSLPVWLEPGQEVEVDLHLYRQDVACVCPYSVDFSRELGEYARLSIYLNENACTLVRPYLPRGVEWRCEWDNKTVIENACLSIVPQYRLFKFIPGVRIRLVFKNVHTTVSGYAVFECPYSQYKLEYAIRMVSCCWQLVGEIILYMFRHPDMLRALLRDPVKLAELISRCESRVEERRGR